MFSTFQQIYPPYTHTRTSPPSPQSYFLFCVRHQKIKDKLYEFSIIFLNPLIMLHPPLFLLYCARSTKICYFSLHSLELHSKGNHMIRFRETNISRKKKHFEPPSEFQNHALESCHLYKILVAYFLGQE